MRKFYSCLSVLLIAGCTIRKQSLVDELDAIELRSQVEDSNGEFRSFQDVTDQLSEILPLYYESIGIDSIDFIDDILLNLANLREKLVPEVVVIFKQLVESMKRRIRAGNGRTSHMLMESVHMAIYAVQQINHRYKFSRIAIHRLGAQLFRTLLYEKRTEVAVAFQLFYTGLRDWLREIDGDSFRECSTSVFIQDFSLYESDQRTKTKFTWETDFRRDVPDLTVLKSVIAKGPNESSLAGMKKFVQLSRSVGKDGVITNLRSEMASIVKMLNN